jgi:hypothetical protein
MRTFADIIAAWPSAEEFGRDIGVSGVTARAMRNRNSIAAQYWRRIVRAAEVRGISGVTLELLAALAAGEPLPESSVEHPTDSVFTVSAVDRDDRGRKPFVERKAS